MSPADTSDDDDKTVTGPPAAPRAGGARADVETGLQAERRRGRAASSQQPGHTLPVGTRLRDYEITGLIGEGGFGIVYLAWDHSLQRKVAIKEYMPASMAARINGSSAIVVKSDRHLDTFRAGLKSFVNEARLLARFDHPSLVKVYRFWEENGTAYMVMPYYEGPTLKAALADLGRAPREEELRAWLTPLLDALAVMHAAQCYHRDIAPDNILLTPRGPLLLDFGAARRVIGDMTHAITVVLKPGYAPIEQYGDVASMTQGAWTDLYALASVVYYAIVGKTPTSSVERLMDDRLEPLAVSAAGRYGAAFLGAIDAALAVRPGDRPQTEREFRALLDADRPAPAAVERDTGPVPYATIPGTLTPPAATQVLARPAATVVEAPPAGAAALFTPSAPLAAPVPPPPVVPRVLPSATPPKPAMPAMPATPPMPPSRPTPPTLATSVTPAAPTRAAGTTRPSGTSRHSMASIAIGLAVVAVIVAAALFVWLRPRDEATVPAAARAASTQPAASSPAAPLALPAASSPAASLTLPSAPIAPVASTPAATPPTASTAPLVERAPVDAVPRVETTIERRPEPSIEPAPREPAPAERASGDRDATAGAASAATRTPRPRREPAPARADTANTAPRTAPHAPSISARCSDILQKASLEPLTAAEAAYLKRECR